ncbi:M1 family metallopeptidase [Nocardioides sp.]|uniref:M1 family metallopeptidase n=1 Tax=Nocardioides sp. TaxID=35761 RepID=UPI0035273EC2
MTRAVRSAGVAAVLACVLAACSADPAPPAPTDGATASPSASADGTRQPTDDGAETDLVDGTSDPVEDSVYPRVGDPSVDALHYDLDLTWDRHRQRLRGVEVLDFRATTTGDSFQLDFGAPLRVVDATLDGLPVETEHDGKDLVVHAAVEADRTYTFALTYAGRPRPVRAPTTRSDFSTTGWTVTDSGSVWTMQEPYGAFTWYAVNDQPSDKALYDFTVHVDAPWVGITNGTLESREVVDGQTVTSFRLQEPASSYLITIAIGDYAVRHDETSGGTPVTYWALRSQRGAFADLSYGTEAIEWIEQRLGPYPFSSAGIVLTESTSGMETQTLVTLGDSDYIRSRPVIVHELVHQWYGDLVTPTDWKDVWMNEGMTTYLQLVYESEHGGTDLDEQMDQLWTYDATFRGQAGPPAAYDPQEFGAQNVYYCPALMWHQLRLKVGDETFWRLVQEWPRSEAFGNADREEWTSWWEAQTGLDLGDFFDAWLLGSTTPDRGL